MSPLFLFPLFGIAAADEVAHNYMNDVIALVLGSFILALAVEHYNIHKRLALNVSFHLNFNLFVQLLEVAHQFFVFFTIFYSFLITLLKKKKLLISIF